MSQEHKSWLTYARTMAAYNQWMNNSLYEVSASLTDAQRKEDLGAFFKSIHGTLNHILVADKIWMGRFVADPFVIPALDYQLSDDFDSMREMRVAEDERIIAWVAGLQVSDVSGDLYFKPMTNPQPRTIPMWLALTHFFNHQTHHRGQLTTLLSQKGMDPGVTDLPYMPGVSVMGIPS